MLHMGFREVAMKVAVRSLAGLPAERQDNEVVERKGLGHPDSLCDALAETLSLGLSRLYRDRFGLILHHNVDKVLLWGGQAEPAFAGGAVRQPIEIYLAGRAIHAYRGVAVPVTELAIEGSRQWLREHLHALDPIRHVVIHPLVRPGSQDLIELFLRAERTGVRLANDTSIGVGYAPLSPLERTVLAVEAALNDPAVRTSHPEIGEDVKVMGIRSDEALRLTVACAFVGRHLRDLPAYLAAKMAVARLAEQAAEAAAGRPVEVQVNTADDPASGSVYLTVTGTSAEAGDDGEAGRGNRANGLITPYRPMTMESIAGKNPVTHVGKLYNLAAGVIAARLVEELPEVAAAECYLVSQIGTPIAEPQLVDLRLLPHEAGAIETLRTKAQQVARAELGRIDGLADELLTGTLAFDRWPFRQPLLQI
jgi:S-adenosylmethionine synthetase